MRGSPARSCSARSHSTHFDSSARTFCEKAVCNWASRSTICASRALASSPSLCAGEHEVEMDPFEQPLLLVVEPERLAPRVQFIDPGEQLRIEIDRAFVRRELRRHIALDSLQRGRSLG